MEDHVLDFHFMSSSFEVNVCRNCDASDESCASEIATTFGCFYLHVFIHHQSYLRSYVNVSMRVVCGCREWDVRSI